MKRILLILFALFCFSSYSQSNNDMSIEKTEIQKKMPVKGTYQFIINDNKNQYVFSNEALFLIESQRKENENVKIELGKNVQVLILSKKYISSKEFIPIDEFVYNL